MDALLRMADANLYVYRWPADEESAYALIISLKINALKIPSTETKLALSLWDGFAC